MAAPGAQDRDEDFHRFNDGFCAHCACAWPCARADLAILAQALGLDWPLPTVPMAHRQLDVP